MGVEIITTVVDGQRFSGWKRVSVSAALDEAARLCVLEAAAEFGSAALAQQFKVGAKIEIYTNFNLLFTGYVDRRQPKISATEAYVVVSGRSLSQDMIDSSAEHETGLFKNKDLKEIAEELNKYGLKIESKGKLKKHKKTKVTPGTTAYRAIERLAKSEGVTITGTADGGIKIWKPGEEPESQAGGIFEGLNLLEGESDHNWSNRYSEYKVIGQKPEDHGEDSLEIEQAVRDSGVRRNRKIIVVQKEDVDKDSAKERAENLRNRSAGASLQATVRLQGFRDSAGDLIEPGKLIWTESPFLDLAQDMIIEKVIYTQDESGSICSLTLTDPRTYGGKKGKGNKSGSSWDQGE